MSEIENQLQYIFDAEQINYDVILEAKREIEYLRAQLQAARQSNRSEAVEELERALCVISVVGKIDGYEVIRRESVINIARDRIHKLQPESEGK